MSTYMGQCRDAGRQSIHIRMRVAIRFLDKLVELAIDVVFVVALKVRQNLSLSSRVRKERSYPKGSAFPPWD